MASFAAACRATARLSSSRAVASRNIATSARCLAAQNFRMPALSPTMTEGNIASWNVKEGDTFSAGDVLLEVETDKATMDVEAQDDGIMVKIMTEGGSKGVPVGQRIAVMAEANDDIKTLEIPADEQASSQAPKQEKKDEKKNAESKDDASGPAKRAAPQATSADSYSHKYPLMPSVGHLIKQHGLSEEDVSKIKGTGPQGRLLKGDILAYMGSIDAERPANLSTRYEKLSHMDLSNVVVGKKTEPPKTEEMKAIAEKPAAPEKLELNIPISLAKVVEVQNKVQKSLGVFLPLSTFISRATEFANDELPALRREPTVDELFDQVLGLDKVKKSTRGFYFPQISALPPPSAFASRPQQKSNDIIDFLSAPSKKPASQRVIPVVPGLSSNNNVFTLVVPKAEEDRAQTFLERFKLILEEDPGRLVL